MKRITIIFAAIVLAAAGAYFATSSKKKAADTRVLAEVSNKSFTVEDLNDRIAKLPPYYQEIVRTNKRRFLDEALMEMVFYEEAVRKGLDRAKDVRELLEAARRKILIAKLIDTEVDEKIRIDEADIRRFYDEHKDEFKSPEMWRASHILVSTEKEAADIMTELSKGASFEELARTRSIDATATRGGDIGYFRRGQVVPEFEKTCLALNVGGMSGIVKTEFGYHIIKLTDKKEPGIEPYEKVRKAIEEELKKAKRAEAFEAFARDLKERYRIRVKEDVFKTLEEAGPKKEGAGGKR
jgi:peptidyl-prolyl cis-trans isomerase C